ncbi:MAG: hypothetical protein O3C40_02085 [Planctomycetota bacterium]|nr:hypothetical protein [Planctomycetota bacterium]
MNITFACPECDHTSRIPLEPGTAVACLQCDWKQHTSAQIPLEGTLDECLVCGCKELFIRKNFSQRIGVAVVVIAATTSLIAWGYYMWYTAFGILFAAALLDLYLYFTVGNLLQCYRCNSEYRGLPQFDEYEAFSLETHERYRQQAIRLAESQAVQSKGA